MEIAKLLHNFNGLFFELFGEAKNSSAIAEGHTDVEIARCVLVLTANRFAPLSRPNRELLKNLEHFI